MSIPSSKFFKQKAEKAQTCVLPQGVLWTLLCQIRTRFSAFCLKNLEDEPTKKIKTSFKQHFGGFFCRF